MQTEHTRTTAGRFKKPTPVFEPYRELAGVRLTRNPNRKKWQVWEGSTLLFEEATYQVAEGLWRKYVEGRKGAGE